MKRAAPPPLRGDTFDAFSRPPTDEPTDEPAGAPPPPPRQYENPSWVKVGWTSVRLLLRRAAAAASVRRGELLGATILLVLGAAAFVLIAATDKPSSDSSADRQASPSPTLDTPIDPPPDPVAAAESARSAAASWVAENIAGGSIVACDAAACADLEAEGYLAAGLAPLRAGGADVRQADVVLVTSAVRARLGPTLDDLTVRAPIAVFGTGQTSVEVREVTLDGPAAYARRASADRADRLAAGQELAGAGGLELAAQPRAQLASGQVDSRILSLLPPLLAAHEISVSRFGVSAEESGDSPLRIMDIARIDDMDVQSGSATTTDVIEFFRAQRPPFAPASVDVADDTGGAVLRLTYAAPSPLGLLGTG